MAIINTCLAETFYAQHSSNRQTGLSIARDAGTDSIATKHPQTTGSAMAADQDYNDDHKSIQHDVFVEGRDGIVDTGIFAAAGSTKDAGRASPGCRGRSWGIGVSGSSGFSGACAPTMPVAYVECQCATRHHRQHILAMSGQDSAMSERSGASAGQRVASAQACAPALVSRGATVLEEMQTTKSRCRSRPAACRTWGVESENQPQRGQFLPGLQAHSSAMGQKHGEKWVAAADLQPTTPKSDRLLAAFLPGVDPDKCSQSSMAGAS